MFSSTSPMYSTITNLYAFRDQHLLILYAMPSHCRICTKKSASILVVDDSIATRFTLATGLRLGGYEVLEAASADEAAILLTSTIHIDLVITDIQMPGDMDGHDLVVYIQKIFPDLPVIVSSGTASQKECMARGVSGFFQNLMICRR